ncbi:MAG: rhomboid family intramembrane serine protease [Bacillota bacterium]|nr:rhomboid family intramembrane serine protease [Bacillota bacterium]
MKEEYAKQLIDGINKRYNGRIMEIEDNQGLVTRWAAEINNYVLLFTDYKESLYISGNQQIQSLQNSGYTIIPVYIEDHIDNENLISPKSVVLNSNDKKIYYSDEGIENLVSIITECISSSAKPKHMDVGIVTAIIIVINVIAYLITAYFSGNLMDADINVLVALGAKYNPLIKAGEYYRLFTCGFLHGGIIHLALNMIALYSVGPIVEKYFGKVKYIIIYIVSLLLSSVLSYLFSDSVSIGASGAIFGLLGSLLIIGLYNRKRISSDFVRSIINVIVINLIIGFTIPNIDNYGHIGGLLGGVLVTFIFIKFKKEAV